MSGSGQREEKKGFYLPQRGLDAVIDLEMQGTRTNWADSVLVSIYGSRTLYPDSAALTEFQTPTDFRLSDRGQRAAPLLGRWLVGAGCLLCKVVVQQVVGAYSQDIKALFPGEGVSEEAAASSTNNLYRHATTSV